jgi:membrane protein YqaA with SNARE-associated domain
VLFQISSQHLRRSAGRHRSPLLHWLVGLGAAGLFFVAVIDSSVIPLPLPGSTDLLLLLLVARRANAWLTAIAAIAGSIVGGYTTWSTGAKGGEAAIKRHISPRYRKRLTRWVESRGSLAVALSALTPPPVPMLPFLLAAGALGVSRRKFLVAYTAARTLRYGLIAWLGATYGRRVARLWAHYLARWGTTIEWTLVALFAAALVYGVWKWRRAGRLSASRPAEVAG